MKRFLDNSFLAEKILISSNQVLRTTFEHKFGAVPAMSQSTTGTVWDVNDTLYPWSAFDTAGTITIQAVNASDNNKQVRIFGLDANWDTQDQIVTVSNTEAVTVPGTWKRVFRAFMANGSVNNVANINIQKGDTTVARISAGIGQTLMAIYTIPRGYNAFLCKGVATAQSSADGSGFMYIRYKDQASYRVGHTFEVAGNGQYNYEFTVPPKIPEQSDIDVRIATRTNNGRYTAAFDLILVKTTQ
jgi:hypothetical protein